MTAAVVGHMFFLQSYYYEAYKDIYLMDSYFYSSPQEYVEIMNHELVNERNNLVQKKFKSSLSMAEDRRLKYVRFL